MEIYQALIKRELLEHRGAFLYAPAVLLAALFVMIIIGLVFGDTHVSNPPDDFRLVGAQIYQIALAGTVGLWTGYLLIALFFYYSDSFSADRRNNSLLFWKSMPQSDLKVLTSKALAGITIFPALLLGFTMITGVLAYLLSFLVASKLSFVPVANPIEMISSWLQMTVVGGIYMMLSVLWYAPFLGWVAGLSTLFQRWSIPLAFLVPGAIVLVELIVDFGRHETAGPIARFLAYRGEEVVDGNRLFSQMFDGAAPLELVPMMFGAVDWGGMAIGIAFAATIVYLASEYRRRRIDA